MGLLHFLSLQLKFKYMSRVPIGFNVFFAAVFILNLLAIDFIPEYKMVLKPLIMASLIGYYIVTSQKQANGFILAMIFALMGDLFLAFEGTDFFLLGLGSFLIMQILYGFTFLRYRIQDQRAGLLKIIPVILLASVVLWLLWPGLGDMRIPVTIYTVAIGFMVCTAFLVNPKLSVYPWLAIGVILFLISDAAIGFSRFGKPFTGIDYLIIGTYMVAQYLIVTVMATLSSKTAGN